MQLSESVVKALAEVLQSQYQFQTERQLNLAIADVLQKTAERTANGRKVFSLSKAIRGLRIVNNHAPLNAESAEADVAYLKALATGATPGSYLVPTIQADDLIPFLSMGGVAQAAGIRLWPMSKIQKMTVPAATGAPTWAWIGQNSSSSATDPNLGQLSFDLKERRCLTVVPNQLLNVSIPQFDTLLAELISAAAGEHFDSAFFASSTVSGGPTALMSAANITVINANNKNANGGNLLYQDLLNILASAAAVKAKPPFVWFFSPRTFYNRVLGLTDSQSRPIVIPTLTEGLYALPQYKLLGWPAFITPFIAENEAVGSGSNQSHAIFTNPTYCHVAQSDSVEIAVSTDRYFEANQTGIRACQSVDLGYAPAAGIQVLSGIN